ncbi:hypothetical protein ACDA55_37195, partial [Rhizobium ruizarguesonis]
ILRYQQKLMEQTFRLDQQLRDRMQLGEPDMGENDPLLDEMNPGENGEPQDLAELVDLLAGLAVFLALMAALRAAGLKVVHHPLQFR